MTSKLGIASFSAQSDLLDEVTKREADWPLICNDGASFLRSKWKTLPVLERP